MTNFEIRIINEIRAHISPFLDKILEFITILGEQLILILVLLIIYFIYSKKAAQKMAFAIFSSLLINNSIKGLVQRVRPFNHPNFTGDASRVHTATGYSFPSGHTQNAAVSYTSLGLTFRKKWLWTVLSILVVLIGLSRVGLGVHYPTDVLAGLLLGVSCAFLGAWLFTKFEHDFRKQMLVYGIVALIFLPFVFIFWRSEWEGIVIYKDFFTVYAFYIGYVAAVFIEHRYVNFDCDNPLKIKFLRTAIALVIVLAIQFGLDKLFPEECILFDMLRYFLLAFVTLGIYPLLARKWLFNTKRSD
jgi:membrane-associated phospholipid phosphatase